MSASEQPVNLVADYLSHHRYAPPERDGWFSMSEIQKGIMQDLGVRVRSLQVLRALGSLQEVKPPVVEDTWMMSNADGVPILEPKYQHPDQPDRARRFYRVISPSVEYIEPGAPNGGINPA